MGKRSNFSRIDKDLYRTIDRRAVLPILPILERDGVKKYAEPCYGGGDLVGHIGNAAECVWKSDITPAPDIKHMDGRNLTPHLLRDCDAIITNPPWSTPLLHELIETFRLIKPTYLLFYADWAHTKQSAPYMDYCSDIITVGRVRWIPDTNCLLYTSPSPRDQRGSRMPSSA